MGSMIDVVNDRGICQITLDRPEAGNIVDYEAIVQVLDVLEEAAPDPEVRVVAVRAAGADFCLGEDEQSMGEWPDRFRDRLHRGTWAEAPIPQQELLSRLWRLPKPTVAVVRGAALGFGLDLSCACDVRLVANDARFGDPRVTNGFPIATGITYLLPRLIGLSQAERILLLGDVIDGKEAERIGLAYRAVDASMLDAMADSLLEKIAGMATRSYALIKRQILEQLDLDHDTALLHSLAIRQTHVIEDQQEGMRAFREKRQPVFAGR